MTNQRVRKAAEDAYLTCFEDVPNPAWMAALIAGKHDNDPVVQAFACFEAEALAQGRLEGAKAGEALRKLVESANDIFQNCEVSMGYCCCGSPVDGHSFGDGHSPVDQGGYSAMRWQEEARLALDPAAIVKEPTDAD